MAIKRRAPAKAAKSQQGGARFSIHGLHGSSSATLPLDDPALVFVGPNGLGKSTIISCLYLFITFQWSRLSSYHFSEIEFTDDSGQSHHITRAQCSQYSRIPQRSSALLERVERRLSGTPDFELFTSSVNLMPAQLRRLSIAVGVPVAEIDRLRSMYRVHLREDPDVNSILQLEIAVKSYFDGQILFLPTYRRIEQDFRALFPRLIDQIQRMGEADFSFDRKTERYHEIIQFGMDDIQQLWSNTSAAIQSFAKTQLSSLMSNYLRDIIRGAAADVDTDFFRDIQDSDIGKVLSRVEENALSLEDQEVLRVTVQSLRDSGPPEAQALYLGYFFQRLSVVVRAIEQQESRVRDLVDTLNGYFSPSKKVNYDPVSYVVSIQNMHGQVIDLASLSSGEKQIVSLFSILFLGEAKSHWIIIDEPELSLSVPWQQMFLDDIFKNAKCTRLTAVTHSPFVYENALKPYAKDISRFIVADETDG